MNNNILPIIKYSALIVLGFFSYTYTAFATGLVLTPATVTSVTETSADLVARVTSEGWGYPSVWFEWGETQAFERPVAGMTTIPTAGNFYARLSDLKPQTSYYFRAVAMDQDGNKITSPTVSFTTKSTEVPVVVTPVVVTTTTVSPTTNKDTTQTTKTASTAKKSVVATSKVVTEKSTTDTKKSDTTTTATNAYSASVIGAGGPLPTTLIGWILIFILVVVVVLLAHMVYKSNQERKLLEEAKKKALNAGA